MKKRIITALLTIVMLTALCTPTVSAATYTVQKGDNLSAISARLLGNASRWKEIYELNKDIIKNPNLIYIGQVLEIPGAEPAQPTQPAQPSKPTLPAEPEYGANPEYPLWTVVAFKDGELAIPVTVCASSDLTKFEVLFTLGDKHKMVGTKSDAGVEITYSRVEIMGPFAIPMVEAAIAQNIWLPVAECPLAYVDPAAEDNVPLYLRAGVWEDEFERANDNLNALPYLVKDETIAAYKTSPVAADKKGTVDTLEYKTGNGTAYAYVYLPASYDKAKEYNVLYLLHGGGGNAASWFTNTDADDAGFHDGDDITNDLSYAVNILDNMFANGDADPCIVVTPNASDVGNFGSTLRDLIAAVDKSYPTKADRENRALAGLSMGSIATWTGGIVGNLDNISWFANMSGGPVADVAEAETYVKESVIPALDAAAAKGYNVNMMLSLNGVFDMALPPHVAAHNTLVDYAKNSDVLEVGENYDFLVSDGAHDWDAWNLYLYDILTVFFR